MYDENQALEHENPTQRDMETSTLPVTLPPAGALPPTTILPPTANVADSTALVPASTSLVPGTVIEPAAASKSSGGSGYRTIPWTELPISDILPGKPETKNFETTGKNELGQEVTEKGTYFDIPVLNCPGGNPETAKPEHFYAEGPPMMSYGGITSRLMGGKMSYSLKLSFRSPGATKDDDPVYDETAKNFKTWMNQVWFRTGQFIEIYKAQVKLPDFSSESEKTLRMCGYKNKVFTPVDDFTQEPVEEKSTMFVKLLNWESTKDGSTDRTKFIDLNGELIDWKLLQRNLVMALVPNFYIKKIYVSAKPSLQILLKSAVVIWAKPIEHKLPQLDTVMRLKAAFPNLGNSLRSQLAALEEEGEEPRSEERTDRPAITSGYSSGTMSDISSGAVLPPVSSDTPI